MANPVVGHERAPEFSAAQRRRQEDLAVARDAIRFAVRHHPARVDDEATLDVVERALFMDYRLARTRA